MSLYPGEVQSEEGHSRRSWAGAEVEERDRTPEQRLLVPWGKEGTLHGKIHRF